MFLLVLIFVFTSSQALYSLNSTVIQLTTSDFDKLVLVGDEIWVVEFFAPWCGHCQAFVSEYTKVATALKGIVKVGAVNADQHQDLAHRYHIRRYPTVKIFATHKHKPEDYTGPRSAQNVIDAILVQIKAKIQAGLNGNSSVTSSELIQLIDESTFEKVCHQRTLCVVAFMPHLLDCQSECRNDYITTLKNLAEKYKEKMWGWGWSEGGVQTNLEASLDVGGYGYPAMTVINLKKRKFSILRGAFSRRGIDEFLRDLSQGRGKSFLFKEEALPKIVTTKSWNGRDAKITQEDVDLSDVEPDNKDEL